jgi:hypothetical protein
MLVHERVFMEVCTSSEVGKISFSVQSYGAYPSALEAANAWLLAFSIRNFRPGYLNKW